MEILACGSDVTIKGMPQDEPDMDQGMSAIQIPRLHAVSFLRQMSVGRTKPCLMLCKDDTGVDYEVVVKMRAGIELKTIGLICELLTAQLANDLDLAVPKPFLVDVELDFHLAIQKPEIAHLVANSVGLNFGSQLLPSGVSTWPKDKPIPSRLQSLAAEVFAFDILTQNPDRRRENPNLLWSGDEIYLCDHEQAFSFLAGVIGWKPPWTGLQLDFFRNHVFFKQLKGNDNNWNRMTGALEALTDARFQEYIEAVPNEWKTNNDAVDQIAGYLRDARQNRLALFEAINHLLK